MIKSEMDKLHDKQSLERFNHQIHDLPFMKYPFYFNGLACLNNFK